MYQNLRWIEDTHETLEYLEIYRDKLPVNPPGSHLAEGDISMAKVDILNWRDDDDEFVFEPRLRDNVGWVSRITLYGDDPELDGDYCYDCD